MKRRIALWAALMMLTALLLSSCGPPPAAEPFIPDSPTPSMPQAQGGGVRTDYSGLSPYEPPRELYTRLSEGPMASLAPSADYGPLLPYVGETMHGQHSYQLVRRYGLVTTSGMIVTDPVYTRIIRGSYYDEAAMAGSREVPAYRLDILPEKVDMDSMWRALRCAACALDGSWTTQPDYRDVVFCDDSIYLVRDHEKNDADVIDYSGRLLFKTRDLDCYGDLRPSSLYDFTFNRGEGLVGLTLADDTGVYLESATGRVVFSGYEQPGRFASGRAPVQINGLYGYIDENFNLALPAVYRHAEPFYGDMAVVALIGGDSAIIDRDGYELIRTGGGISRWGVEGYAVYGDDATRYYDTALNPFGPQKTDLSFLGGGWYAYWSQGDLVLYDGNTEYTLSGIDSIHNPVGNLIVTYTMKDEWRTGVMTFNGTEILPLAKGVYYHLYRRGTSEDVYIVGTNHSENPWFAVYDSGGSQLFSGEGTVTYYGEPDLFAVENDRAFRYVDGTGRPVFSLSLLQYVPD